ncbi:alpha/beta hydrolase [Radiobacillus kanasensis]|uniref:alpha/beta hydrolase n=1 Tax=Radiobacillus kanasensis TaxID=2844358 RepID=UPI001E400163|nr:alpha/beta hydrolase-fold protein [Radiobacillus kanasensis]UFT98300.1 alpha/beta hydrolase [Radiobacillus kanasensis]
MKGFWREEKVNDHSLFIYLPQDYKETNKRFPVLYVQDGAALFKDQIEQVEEKMNKGQQVILVGIEPINRIDEYTPWHAPALRDDFPDYGGKGKEYIDLVVEEIKPFIDKQYRTRPEKENTGIIGASLGGLISLYACYKYSDVFTRFGLLSTSLWYEGFLSFMRSQHLNMKNQRMFLSVGESEGENKTNVQKDMVSNTEEAIAIMRENGLKEYTYKKVPGRKHEVAFFQAVFPEAVAWLFRNQA